MVFKPGQSGNPSGRPKAAITVSRMIREMTNDGEDLVMFALQVWNGAVKGMDDSRSRQWAHEWLSERGLGKAPDCVDDGGELSGTPEQHAMVTALMLSPHDRRQRAEELKARASPPEPALVKDDAG